MDVETGYLYCKTSISLATSSSPSDIITILCSSSKCTLAKSLQEKNLLIFGVLNIITATTLISFGLHLMNWRILIGCFLFLPEHQVRSSFRLVVVIRRWFLPAKILAPFPLPSHVTTVCISKWVKTGARIDRHRRTLKNIYGSSSWSEWANRQIELLWNSEGQKCTKLSHQLLANMLGLCAEWRSQIANLLSMLEFTVYLQCVEE